MFLSFFDIDEAKELEIGVPYDAEFPQKSCEKIRIILDDDIARSYVSERHNERQYPQRHNVALTDPPAKMPPMLAKAFDVFIKKKGIWEKLFSANNNYKRLIYIPCGLEIEGIRLTVKETHGGVPRVYSIS